MSKPKHVKNKPHVQQADPLSPRQPVFSWALWRQFGKVIDDDFPFSPPIDPRRDIAKPDEGKRRIFRRE